LPHYPSTPRIFAKILAAKERKEHKEKGFYLSASLRSFAAILFGPGFAALQNIRARSVSEKS
jgi:hypothetical protein